MKSMGYVTEFLVCYGYNGALGNHKRKVEPVEFTLQKWMTLGSCAKPCIKLPTDFFLTEKNVGNNEIRACKAQIVMLSQGVSNDCMCTQAKVWYTIHRWLEKI